MLLAGAAACARESPVFDVPAASSAQSVTGPPAGAAPSFELAPLRISAGKWTGFEDRNGRPFWPTGMITGGGAYGGAEGWPLIDDATLRLIHDNGGNFTHVMVARLVIHLSVRPAMASRGDASRFPLDDLRNTTRSPGGSNRRGPVPEHGPSPCRLYA